jgi:hypothetical protein
MNSNIFDDIFKYLAWPEELKVKTTPPSPPYPPGVDRLWQWTDVQFVEALKQMKKITHHSKTTELLLYLDEIGGRKRLTVIRRPKTDVVKGGRGLPREAIFGKENK